MIGIWGACCEDFSSAVIQASELELTKDTPYLALLGEIWGVCCEDFSGAVIQALH